ncbi:tyrosine-type recombinase/integrase [Pseudomonas sp. TWP3-2]|uniref:tyrosine-type recombinase/integrase n=1 Tax=Pseudomonas sp. TWP3-2 TaxID=2804574 RepID=UPI003CEBF702
MNLAGGKQLYTPLPNLKLFGHHALGRVEIKDGANLPFLVWPNCRPCIPANLYMLALRDTPGRHGAPLSRRGSKGGTIGDHAAKISQLIRFCYQKKVDFLELTDSQFADFISEIRMQRFKNNIRQRQKNSKGVNLTGQVCLKFLQHIGNIAGRPDFVAPNGAINISYREFLHKSTNGRTFKTTSIYHHSFSVGGDAADTRNPISDRSITALKNAADEAGTSRFLNLRRHIHMLFLEHTGPRRGELAELKVSSINKAFSMKHPMLELTTLKKGISTTRQVPVSKMLLNEARKYIKFARSKVICKFTKSGRPDHDFLFISETTGKPLADTTITNEINSLAKFARIDAKACPHMFRHAFCTNLFVILYQRYKFSDSKEFEIRLLSDHLFLEEVLQYTGHSSIIGLLPYLKTAYTRLNKIDETISSAHILILQQEFESHLLQLCKQLENGLTIKEYLKEVYELLDLKNEDVGIIQSLPKI